MDFSKFHVLTMTSNPVGFKSRPRLYNEFKPRVLDTGLTLWTCEIAMGDQQSGMNFEVTQAGDPHVLQLKTVHELWHKENALNLLAQKLPSDWEYLAWIDSDVTFQQASNTPPWYELAFRALQTYRVVQLWENCIDYGPTGQFLQAHTSFVHAYQSGRLMMPKQKGRYLNGAYSHPGYAWAICREAFEGIGGLYDKAILGSGDNHMAWSFIGKPEQSIHKDLSAGYRDSVVEFASRCERFVRRDIGYLPISISHDFHGKKKNRFYQERWKTLIKHQYDPYKDLKRDSQGLYQLDDRWETRSIGLRDDVRLYFRSRQEDSIDLE